MAKKSFGVVILDEAHKARASARHAAGADHGEAEQPARIFSTRSRATPGSVILGTATPIQLDAVELWDLLAALGQGAPQVLGTPFDGGEWMREESIQFLTGERPWPQNETADGACSATRCRRPREHSVFRDIRNDARTAIQEKCSALVSTNSDPTSEASSCKSSRRSPSSTIRSSVVSFGGHGRCLRSAACLKRIGVITHPRADDGLPTALFDNRALSWDMAFKRLRGGGGFSRLYAARRPGAGFLKTILLRRIGSSARAGLETARHLLDRMDPPIIPEDEIGDEACRPTKRLPDPQEIQLLREVERNLAAVVDGTDVDPKVQVILHYLREQNWLEMPQCSNLQGGGDASVWPNDRM